MRVIDAEALKQSVREKFKALSDRCEINELVNAAPTIAAIPVQWIENRLNAMLKGTASAESCFAVILLLADWQREQEER